MAKSVQSPPQIEYEPYDDASQLARYIDRYPLSFTRTPLQPLIERPLTLSELSGPTDLERKFEIGDGDLSRSVASGPRAIGQLIEVQGRLMDEDGSPLSGAVIELWQANAAGKYIHEMDQTDSPIDPRFTGQGRIRTDTEGRYRFLTIKPGAYPVLESGWWWRPPHIHFSIFGPSWMNRYVTQIFFPGEPLNETDLLLNAVPDRETRDRLIFQPTDPKIGQSTGAPNTLGFQLDFVLRGRRRTPELD